ncbi:MAG TPA: hypothetical protein VF097_07520 [Actinomycetota bacterium]
MDRAWERIEDDSYRVCEAWGKPIAREWLAAIPAARFRAEAQARLEASGS